MMDAYIEIRTSIGLKSNVFIITTAIWLQESVNEKMRLVRSLSLTGRLKIEVEFTNLFLVSKILPCVQLQRRFY
jgi:hypothetical protein